MSIVDIKPKRSIRCLCDNIEAVQCGYGRTPYMIGCSTCNKYLHNFIPTGVGYSLNHEHAAEAFNDFINAIEWLRENKQKTTSERLCEYFYRKYKGWPENPC